MGVSVRSGMSKALFGCKTSWTVELGVSAGVLGGNEGAREREELRQQSRRLLCLCHSIELSNSSRQRSH